MKRSLVSALIFVVCLIAPQIAAATTASSDARLSQTVIVHGETVAMAKVNVHEMFSSVEMVCFELTFVNDLLDPGEILQITPLQVYPSLSGFGFMNGGTTSESTRTVCVASSGYADVLALFVDGKDKNLELSMGSGSVEVASLTVKVTGTPRS
jgi:hypothetical protein